MLWYSFEAPRRGASNEYHNIFLPRNKKNIMQIPPYIHVSGAVKNNKKKSFGTGKR